MKLLERERKKERERERICSSESYCLGKEVRRIESEMNQISEVSMKGRMSSAAFRAKKGLDRIG